MKKLKKFSSIDPLKGFIELPILWFVVIILFSIACTVSVIIIVNSDLQISLDYNGFNSFVEIFRVPLGILAIIITFIAFLATAHRSAQTREQIVNTNQQNIFSNYYKHIEEFEKYFQTTINIKSIYLPNLRETHKYLFPHSFYGDYSINKEFIVFIETELLKCQRYLEMFNIEGEKSACEIFFNLYSSIDYIFSKMEIKVLRGGRQFFYGGIKFSPPDENIRNAIGGIKKEIILLKQILSFDHSIVFLETMNSLINMEEDNIPSWSFLIDKASFRFNLFK